MKVKDAGEYQIFRGPNGWYVAVENSGGFHHQPEDGGHMTRVEAERHAKARNVGCTGWGMRNLQREAQASSARSGPLSQQRESARPSVR
jgi:hypothetical protein